MLAEVVRGAHAPVELVAQLVQDPDARQDLHLVLVAPHREEDVLLRDPEARAHHGLGAELLVIETRFGPNRVAADMEGNGEFDF